MLLAELSPAQRAAAAFAATRKTATPVKSMPVVVDFWGVWCGPCRMLGRAIESEVEKRAGKLELAKIDVDAEQKLAARYGIQSIPTVAVFRDGEPVNGFVGAYPPAAIRTFLDDLLAKEDAAAAA